MNSTRDLDAKLQDVRSHYSQYQNMVAVERVAATPAEKQNIYQPGELVLWQRAPTKSLPTKLTPNFLGPYMVIKQY